MRTKSRVIMFSTEFTNCVQTIAENECFVSIIYRSENTRPVASAIAQTLLDLGRRHLASQSRDMA